MLGAKGKPTTVEAGEVKGREIAGHAIAGIGQNLVFGFWGSYMLVFFTDVFAIGGVAAGMIMMLTRVWDAVNDPMMGALADRTRTRWGRFRPWLLFMALPIAIMLVLNFSAPNLGPTGKIVYAAIVYVLMSMTFTAIDVPYWTMPAAMSNSVAKRTVIYSASRTSTTVTTAVVAIVAVPLITALGGGSMARGYQSTAIVFGVAAVVLYLTGFSLIREHVVPAAHKKVGFKESTKVIFHNKPLLMIMLSVFIAFSCYFIRNSMMIYFMQYNLGSLELMSLVGLVSIPGVIVGAVLTPALAKRFGQKSLYIFSCLFAAAVNLILFFTGYTNTVLVFVLYAITCFPLGVLNVLLSSLIANTVEYAEWKTGQRREGLINSSQTFVFKLCIAAAGGLSGFLLSALHYTPGVAQPQATLTVFHMSISLVFAVGLVLAVVPMLFYELTEKRHAELVSEIESRKSRSDSN